MRKLNPLNLIALVLLLLAAMNTQAQSFCFLSASSYYEQVYCELQARGEARGLPPFQQFKRNDEVIQAAILKRPAQRNGIKLPTPAKRTSLVTRTDTTPVAPSLAPLAKLPQAPVETAPGLSNCQLAGQYIRCGARQYQLTGNRANRHLAADALTEANAMALPSYQGPEDATGITRYLTTAYRAYIDKMHAIGLAGATLTYEKFAFLFYDLRDKNLDFSQRFETMYTFLKKDKKTLGVSEKVSVDSQLQLSDCADLADDLLVCSRAGRNYLFIAGSE